MEKFKAVEKEMKTKAFSKEGLSANPRIDPKDKEKIDLCSFIAEMVEELDRQMETLEAEEEALQVTAKKGKKDQHKADRLSEITQSIERHKWHQNKLELLLRAVENGNVEVEQVNDVKDLIKYYVEENQNVDFVEDDSIYDDFNLEQDEATWGIGNDNDRVSSQDNQSVQDDITEAIEPKVSNGKQKAGSEPPGPSARRPSIQAKSPLPALATLHTPLTTTAGNVQSATSMKPAPPPPRGETLKYASAAAAAAASDKNGIPSLPPPPGSSSLAPIQLVSSKSANTSPATVPSIPVTNAKPPMAAVSPTISQAATGSVQNTPALESSEPVSSKAKAMGSTESLRQETEASPEPEEPATPPPPPTHIVTNGVDKKDEQVESIFHLPECLQDLVSSFEATRNRPIDINSAEYRRLLNASSENMVDVIDVEKPRFYRPQNKYATPRHYPSEPSTILDDQTIYERIDNDTLFFLFYYRQNTYQQYQAAKALKSQSWRFHKQYQTWFQRHEEPKTITEEYEQGTYRFFDYESTWYVRFIHTFINVRDVEWWT
jgi:CCR4-NOT transcription complex subunit 3